MAWQSKLATRQPRLWDCPAMQPPENPERQKTNLALFFALLGSAESQK
jgi:hypothetical protein